MMGRVEKNEDGKGGAGGRKRIAATRQMGKMDGFVTQCLPSSQLSGCQSKRSVVRVSMQGAVPVPGYQLCSASIHWTTGAAGILAR